MSFKAAKLVNRKHKLYKKYKCKSHSAYTKVAREAQNLIEIRRAKRSFERKQEIRSMKRWYLSHC